MFIESTAFVKLRFIKNVLEKLIFIIIFVSGIFHFKT